MTETRNLRALPFRPSEGQLSTGKAWEEWLEDIEREFRYFRISSPADRKDAMIIYGGKEIARLEKSLSDPDDPDSQLNEYEKMRKKLNDYFSPRQNKHYSRYMFLKLRPFAGEATIAYAARLRERAYDCDFGDTFDARILEHLIQTIENKLLIQKCIAKCWNLTQFLSEAAQIEDISLQVHDMKYNQDDRYIARVRRSRKQKSYHNYRSSDEDDEIRCRYCGYYRKHRTIEDCPAYGQKCHSCQKLNHFASVCKSQRSTDGASNKNNSIQSTSESKRLQKIFDTEDSDSSDDGFVSTSAAHMLRIKTVKTNTISSEEEETSARSLHHEGANIRDQRQQCKNHIELIRHEIQRHTRELEMKFEQKLNVLIDQMSALKNALLNSVSRDDIANLQLKDGIDDVEQSKSPVNEMHGQPQRHTENSTCARNNLTANVHSCDSSNDGTGKDDSDLEDSSFIGGSPTTQVKPFRKEKEKA